MLFLNALAFGMVAPLLYYVIVLPDAIWIGLLFVVDSAGRIAGGPAIEQLQQRLGIKRSLILMQSIAVVSYIPLWLIAYFQITHATAIAAVYLSRFIGAFAPAGFPAAGLLFQRTSSKMNTTRASLLTMVGFAVGCALTIPGNNHWVRFSIFETGGLSRSAGYAALISCIAVLAAWRMPPQRSNSADAPAFSWKSPVPVAIVFLCEAAFGMTLCVLPLMQRETYFFTPAKVAIFLGSAAAISAAVQAMARPRPTGQIHNPFAPIRMNLGILLAALGFLGFVTALKLSWVTHPLDGMKVGYWLVWIAGIPAAIGHGLLRAALPSILRRSKQPPVRPHAALRFDQLCALVSASSALLGAAVWLAHERSSFAMPCVLAAAALLLLGAYSFTVEPPRAAELITQKQDVIVP